MTNEEHRELLEKFLTFLTYLLVSDGTLQVEEQDLILDAILDVGQFLAGRKAEHILFPATTVDHQRRLAKLQFLLEGRADVHFRASTPLM